MKDFSMVKNTCSSEPISEDELELLIKVAFAPVNGRRNDPDLPYEEREALKYKAPPDDASIREWIIALLKTARAHWNRAVQQEGCDLWFRAFLHRYLRNEDWFNRFGGRWSEAAEAVRLALG
jgi:hypothetical protein